MASHSFMDLQCSHFSSICYDSGAHTCWDVLVCSLIFQLWQIPGSPLQTTPPGSLSGPLNYALQSRGPLLHAVPRSRPTHPHCGQGVVSRVFPPGLPFGTWVSIAALVLLHPSPVFSANSTWVSKRLVKDPHTAHTATRCARSLDAAVAHMLIGCWAPRLV